MSSTAPRTKRTSALPHTDPAMSQLGVAYARRGKRFKLLPLGLYAALALQAGAFVAPPLLFSQAATTNTAVPAAAYSAEKEAAADAARAAYYEDAKTNHIRLEKPLYTNAPYFEIRLRAAALAGDGFAASLCNGTNETERAFWSRLAATNGWVPAQIALAGQSEQAARITAELKTVDTNTLQKAQLNTVLTNGQTFTISLPFDTSEKEFKNNVLTNLPGAVFVRWIGRGPGQSSQDTMLAKHWRAKAQAALPKLQADAARTNLHAMFALALLHSQGDLVQSNRAIADGLIRQAAELGLAPAQEFHASHYEYVAADYTEASRWYYLAATQGLASAQSALVFLHGPPLAFRFDPKFQPHAYEAARWDLELAYQTPSSLAYFGCLGLGTDYHSGLGVESNRVEAVRWFRRAADIGFDKSGGRAEYELALCYFGGDGVPQSDTEGLRWLKIAMDRGHKEDVEEERYLANQQSQSGLNYTRKLAAQGDAWAQGCLGARYFCGAGVAQNWTEAHKWWRRAANQGHEIAQRELGGCYLNGHGVPRDYVEAYKWYNLAAASSSPSVAETARLNLDNVTRFLTPSQIAEAQRLSREFVARKEHSGTNSVTELGSKPVPKATGTAFFITDTGHLLTAAHVVEKAGRIQLSIAGKAYPAVLVKVDKANDVAVLKVDGTFKALPLAASRSVKLGDTVFTIGFPNTGVQGTEPKLTKGEISSLAGIQDDPRHFQISAPVQPGNSGGPLVDMTGNVVGLVTARLGDMATLRITGSLPQNVNYALKTSFIIAFLETLPDIAAKLKEPETRARKFEDVVKSAEQSTVLVVVF